MITRTFSCIFLLFLSTAAMPTSPVGTAGRRTYCMFDLYNTCPSISEVDTTGKVEELGGVCKIEVKFTHSDEWFLCAGTIVGEHHLLTTLQCTYDPCKGSYEIIRVRCGYEVDPLSGNVHSRYGTSHATCLSGRSKYSPGCGDQPHPKGDMESCHSKHDIQLCYLDRRVSDTQIIQLATSIEGPDSYHINWYDEYSGIQISKQVSQPQQISMTSMILNNISEPVRGTPMLVRYGNTYGILGMYSNEYGCTRLFNKISPINKRIINLSMDLVSRPRSRCQFVPYVSNFLNLPMSATRGVILYGPQSIQKSSNYVIATPGQFVESFYTIRNVGELAAFNITGRVFVCKEMSSLANCVFAAYTTPVVKVSAHDVIKLIAAFHLPFGEGRYFLSGIWYSDSSCHSTDGFLMHVATIDIGRAIDIPLCDPLKCHTSHFCYDNGCVHNSKKCLNKVCKDSELCCSGGCMENCPTPMPPTPKPTDSEEVRTPSPAFSNSCKHCPSGRCKLIHGTFSCITSPIIYCAYHEECPQYFGCSQKGFCTNACNQMNCDYELCTLNGNGAPRCVNGTLTPLVSQLKKKIGLVGHFPLASCKVFMQNEHITYQLNNYIRMVIGDRGATIAYECGSLYFFIVADVPLSFTPSYARETLAKVLEFSATSSLLDALGDLNVEVKTHLSNPCVVKHGAGYLAGTKCILFSCSNGYSLQRNTNVCTPPEGSDYKRSSTNSVSTAIGLACGGVVLLVLIIVIVSYYTGCFCKRKKSEEASEQPTNTRPRSSRITHGPRRQYLYRPRTPTNNAPDLSPGKMSTATEIPVGIPVGLVLPIEVSLPAMSPLSGVADPIDIDPELLEAFAVAGDIIPEDAVDEIEMTYLGDVIPQLSDEDEFSPMTSPMPGGRRRRRVGTHV